MRLLTVAGELSGDAHGGALLSALGTRLPGLEAWGIGGPRMREAGLQPEFPLEVMQVHGLLEVVRHLPRLYRVLWRLEATLDARRPDALLLIDYPGFNLKLAAAARRRGIPVFFYCSPQVWAWRGGRIRSIARAVDHMIVLFPFEAELYRQAGVRASFLGHPLVGLEAEEAEVDALRERLGLGAEETVVAVMPGSRPSELQRNLPVLLESIRRIQARGYAARFLLPLAGTLHPEQARAMVRESGAPVEVLEHAFLPLLKLAHLGLVASGTATLQVAMAGIPFLVVYRVSPLTFFLARRFAYVQHIAMVNILARREVVPELLQADFTPERVADAFLALAGDPARQARLRADLLATTAQLGEPGAYGRAADYILEHLGTAGADARAAGK